MLANLVSGFSGNGLNKIIEIIAFKQSRLSAFFAQKQMLVTRSSRDESLTSAWLVNTLDKAQLLELIKRSIN
jgi:hypothetical protein